MNPKFRRFLYPIGLGVLAGLFYEFGFERLGSEWGGVMMLGFLIGVPIALGAISAHFTPADASVMNRYVVRPLLMSFAFVLAALLFKVEGVICLIIVLPLFISLGIIGVALHDLLSRRNPNRDRMPVLTGLVIFPLFIGVSETYFALPESIQRVENSVTIAASPAVVWEQIVRVPPIRAEELTDSPVDWLGFPRPVEATVTKEGLGGVRHASFEGGVLFVETVDRWEAQRCLSFSIKAQTETIPPTTFDEHIVVGGKYFDVLRGTYELQPTADGQTSLLLWSDHRLNTRLNPYAGIWTRYVMSEIQRRILTVVSHRAEAAKDIL